MSGPAPEDLGTHRALAANELDNLYYVGLRWMDRARKAEALNVDLLEALNKIAFGVLANGNLEAGAEECLADATQIARTAIAKTETDNG